MKTIYLHVGYHKTGTTAIQTLLSANRERLAGAGILYPRACERENNPAFCQGRSFAHHALPNLLLQERHREPRMLRAQIDRLPCERVVISSEVFMERFKNEAAALAALTSLLEGLDVRVLLYLRPQHSLFESVYNQQVKDSDRTPILDPTALPRYYDYLFWIRVWERHFGKGKIIVRPFEREQLLGGNVLADFLDAIDSPLRLEDLEVPPDDANPRLNRDALLFKRMVNASGSGPRTKAAFTGPLLRYSQGQSGQGARFAVEHGLLTPAERWAIHVRHKDRNAVIAREYLDREDGRLFFDQPPPPGQAKRMDTIGDPLTPASTATIADAVLADLRPDLDDVRRREALSAAIVDAALRFIEPAAPSNQAGNENEKLRTQLAQNEAALRGLRIRYSEALQQIARLTPKAAPRPSSDD